VFPARYELNSYIVYRERLVSKRLRLFYENECAGVWATLNGRADLFYEPSCSITREEFLDQSNDLIPEIRIFTFH
jgi:hypothetical protein